jgi:opacity protein-like surface antigen
MRVSLIRLGLISLIAFLSICFAESVPGIGYYVYSTRGTNEQPNPNNFDGGYLGLSFNLNPAQYKFVPPGGLSRFQLTKTLMTPGLYGGYGWVINKLTYIGFEANYRFNMSGAEHSIQVGSRVIDDLNQTWSAGGSVLVGGVIADTSLLYFIGGLQRTHVKYVFINTTRTSVGKGLLAIRGGLGVALQLSDNVNFDFRYQLEHYKNLKATTTIPKTTLVNNIITLGLSYHFV